MTRFQYRIRINGHQELYVERRMCGFWSFMRRWRSFGVNLHQNGTVASSVQEWTGHMDEPVTEPICDDREKATDMRLAMEILQKLKQQDEREHIGEELSVIYQEK